MEIEPKSSIIYTSQITLTDWIASIQISIILGICMFFSFTGWCTLNTPVSTILTLILGGIALALVRGYVCKFIILEDKIVVTNHHNRNYKELYPVMIERIDVCTAIGSGMMFNIHVAGKRKQYNVSIDVSDRTLCEIITVCRTMGIFVDVDKSIAKQLGIEHQN